MLFLMVLFSSSMVFPGALFEVATAAVEATVDTLEPSIKVPYVFGYSNFVVEKWLNSLIWENTSGFVRETLEQTVKSLKAVEETGGDASAYRGVAYVRGEIFAASKKYLSVVLEFYAYVPPAAHGSVEKRSFNVDLERGVFQDFYELFSRDQEKIIKKNIIKRIEKEPQRFFSEAVKIVEGYRFRDNFYLDEDAVVVFFKEYEISPGYVGVPEFRIPFSELDFSLCDEE